MPKPVHKHLQLNGVCWDCGASGARPVVSYQADCVGTIGWRCVCGRWWEVTVTDVFNWARAFTNKSFVVVQNGAIDEDCAERLRLFFSGADGRSGRVAVIGEHQENVDGKAPT